MTPSKTYDLVAIVIYIYDYLLTLESEVSLVWQPDADKRKFVNILYFVARYTPLPILVFSLFREPFSYPSIELEVWKAMMFVAIMASEIILFVRTYAIWDRYQRVILMLFSTLFAVESITMLIVMYTNTLYSVYGTFAILSNELIVISLTLIRYWRMPDGSELAKVLLRDSIVYFSCILATSFINLSTLFFHWEKQNGFPEIQLAMHSVFSTRVVLNLRENRSDLNSHEMQLLSQLSAIETVSVAGA